MHAATGDSARALTLLERAARERDPSLANVACRTTFERLRPTPRFESLMHTMNVTAAASGRR
jgi:hypothetical protein